MTVTRLRLPLAPRILLVLTACALLLLVAWAVWSRPVEGGLGACGPVASGAIVESEKFTPPGGKLTHGIVYGMKDILLDPMPLVPGEARVPGNAIDGSQLIGAILGPDGEVYQYFFPRAVTDDVTTDTFPAEGGIRYERVPARGVSFADQLAEQVAERAVRIEVGPYLATLTWADPSDNGTRTHNLYWSDGTYNYALVADRPASTLVNIGRGLVCKGV